MVSTIDGLRRTRIVALLPDEWCGTVAPWMVVPRVGIPLRVLYEWTLRLKISMLGLFGPEL